jgi:hypothetical protein
MMTTTPAEAVAAALCWLARFRHGALGSAYEGVMEAGGYWHKANCRFCDLAPDVLIAAYNITRVDADALKAFNALPRPARAARIREAQEVPWYESLEG